MNTPLRILHLEDNSNDAELIKQMLISEGIECQVVCVASRAEYQRALASGEFHLIFSDYSLPSFDGQSALTLARVRHPDTPFIFVSATIGEERAIDLLKSGATDYVLKDRLTRLVPAVKRALTEVEERSQRRDVEQQFQMITENMADLVAVLDLGGRRLYTSPSYASLLDSAALLPGTDFFTEVHADDRERIVGVFHEAVQTGSGKRTEYRLVSFRGDVRTIESQASTIKDEAGKPDRVIMVSRDITDRRKLEEQFLHAQKMEVMGTLAGGIAHDFNNVLSIILGYLYRLSRESSSPQDLAKGFETMTTAARRGAGLVRQLLTFSRKREVTFESLSINATVDEVLQMCSQVFPRQIALKNRPGSDIPAVLGDRNQLNQALLNLCVNARDAMPDGGTLTVATSTETGETVRRLFPQAEGEQFVAVSVIDTGMGMDAATRARVFEPFFTTKAPGQGTGLGLAMVHGVADNHHGFVGLESTPRQGTTFSIYLPTSSPRTPEARVQEEFSPEGEGGNETILFVEDESMLLELVKTLLETKGYHVLTAMDGLQAVEVFKENRDEISLVLTDIGLPKLDGWEAFLRMRALKPGLEAIVATGYVDRQNTGMLKTAGNNVIQKPYVPDQILTMVRKVLNNRKR